VAKTKAARVLPRNATPPTRRAIDPRADEGVATQMMPAEKPRRRGAFVAILIAAAVAVAAGMFLTRRRSEPAVAPPPHVAIAPPTQVVAPTDTALRQSEVQMETAKTLADLVAHRPLTAEEKARFADANSRLDQARTLIAQKDYSAGASLAKSAGDTLRELLSAPAPAANPPVKTASPPPRKHVPPTTTAPPPVVIAQPVVPTPAPVVIQPPPVVVASPPQPAPQKPSRAELEREINTFMHEVAVAYQEKDVSFFRQRAFNYSDQLANAIRNSPSTRVDITVRSIQFSDDSNVSVTARRTDTFAESGMPQGVQTLVFELRRMPDGWKIVRFARAS